MAKGDARGRRLRRECNYGHPIGEGFLTPGLKRKTPPAPAQIFRGCSKKRSGNPLVSGSLERGTQKPLEIKRICVLETANGDTLER